MCAGYVNAMGSISNADTVFVGGKRFLGGWYSVGGKLYSDRS